MEWCGSHTLKYTRLGCHPYCTPRHLHPYPVSPLPNTACIHIYVYIYIHKLLLSDYHSHYATCNLHSLTTIFYFGNLSSFNNQFPIYRLLYSIPESRILLTIILSFFWNYDCLLWIVSTLAWGSSMINPCFRMYNHFSREWGLVCSQQQG